MIAQQLIKKYNLAADSYYTKSPYTGMPLSTEQGKIDCIRAADSNRKLNEKWKSRIPDGWYGFDMEYPTPLIWYKVIDEFLEYVKSACPDFEILQQKVKFGGYRGYLNNINNDIQQETYKLESVLYDKFLIW